METGNRSTRKIRFQKKEEQKIVLEIIIALCTWNQIRILSVTHGLWPRIVLEDAYFMHVTDILIWFSPVHECVCVCVCVRVSEWMCMCVCVCMCVYVYVCMYMCVMCTCVCERESESVCVWKENAGGEHLRKKLSYHELENRILQSNISIMHWTIIFME